MKDVDVIVIGAGAAGLMCAIEAGKRQRKILVLDHANKVGKKILMSGGGRCNFTNYHINPDCYISHNPHFCKSALSRYTQWDFIALVNRHKIPFHEKTAGQLFCNNKSKDIVEMLFSECMKAGVDIHLNASIRQIKRKKDRRFKVSSTLGDYQCQSLVVATGGLSIPSMGASAFAYKTAEQFGINVWPTRAGLVPFTLDVAEKQRFSVLSGVSVDSLVQNKNIHFRENLLFTHRGLSGPAILQISSYWQVGDTLHINLLPEIDLYAALLRAKTLTPQKPLGSFLSAYLPRRLVQVFIQPAMAEKKLCSMTNSELQWVSDGLNAWMIKPHGTEGYRTAEVTLGGVDTHALSSKTMEAKAVPGLYFIGEAVDVTGWLGGYNFQWAWSSGWAAGQEV